MTTFQQALFHAILGCVAIAAAVILAVLGKVDGAEALAIVIAAGGITATGIAGSVTLPSTPASQPASAKTAASTLTPPSTT